MKSTYELYLRRQGAIRRTEHALGCGSRCHDVERVRYPRGCLWSDPRAALDTQEADERVAGKRQGFLATAEHVYEPLCYTDRNRAVERFLDRGQ